jgi:hypothetical protein
MQALSDVGMYVELTQLVQDMDEPEQVLHELSQLKHTPPLLYWPGVHMYWQVDPTRAYPVLQSIQVVELPLQSLQILEHVWQPPLIV